jgi:hypothetical protein
LVTVLLVCGLLGTVLGPARAQPSTDFSLDETSWNSASRLAERAEELGIALEAAVRADVDDLGPETALFLVHPTRPLPVDSLAAFLRRGGRVLLADDFGTGDALLSRYEIRRAPPDAQASPRLRGRPAFPLARPEVRHALTDGVAQVVANHPSALRHRALEPLLAFGDGSALLLTGAVGPGRLVALSDPSVLIDNMMVFPGNQRLADNALTYLVAGGAERVRYLAGGFVLEGRGARPGDPVAALGSWLAEVARSDLPPVALWVGSMMLAALLLVLGGTTLPRRSPYRASAMFPGSPGGGGFAGRVAAHRDGGAPGRLAALLTLKGELERAVLHRLGLTGSHRLDDLLAAARARPGFTDADAADLRRLLTELDELDRREDLPPAAPKVASSRFHAMVRRSRRALARLEEGRRPE